MQARAGGGGASGVARERVSALGACLWIGFWADARHRTPATRQRRRQWRQLFPGALEDGIDFLLEKPHLQ